MKNRKNLVAWLALFVAVLMIGCGGGGAGGGGGNGGNGGPGGGTGGTKPYQGQYIEFISLTRAGSSLDPLNLQVGDEVQLVLANYDAAGTRTTLSFFNVDWSDKANISLTNSGKLKVLSRPPGIFTVSLSATVAGSRKDFVQDCAAPAGSTTISGRVVNDGTLAPAKYIEVAFYDASDAMVAGARSGDGGNFVATVPSSVKTVSIKASTVPAPPYYRSFVYNSKVYTMDASTCPVKLPTLVIGQNNTLPSTLALFLQENGPPPPPDGCKP